MSTTVEPVGDDRSVAVPAGGERPGGDAPGGRRGRGRPWITDWRPDDPRFWADGGARIAWRNLWLSVFAEHLGFCLWVIWTVVVVNLPNAGIQLSLSQQFWLTAVPNLIGSGLRIPYTFAIARFGGRLWTLMSVALLLVPALALAVVVPGGWLRHASVSTQFWVLLAAAATAGVGGGNFSSSMANISFFFPGSRKGLALGINAAGGNLGVAVTQLVVPLVLIIGVPAAAVKLPVHSVHLAYAGLVFLPLIVLAMALAWFRMDSLTEARTDPRAYREALINPHAWAISALYIGTFGSFIGYSFAMPLVIKNTFPGFLAHHPFIATYLGGLTFIGAALGSLSRPLGGWIADRIGGARVTLVSFLGMGAATGVAILGVSDQRFGIFFPAFLVIFALSGIGNGSTYRMIPAIFAGLSAGAGGAGAVDEEVRASLRRQSAAAIGIAGAVGAFGGFLIQVALRQAALGTSKLMTHAATTIHEPHALALAKAHIAAAHHDWSIPALWAFLAAYALLAGLCWALYVRPRRVVPV